MSKGELSRNKSKEEFNLVRRLGFCCLAAHVERLRDIATNRRTKFMVDKREIALYQEIIDNYGWKESLTVGVLSALFFRQARLAVVAFRWRRKQQHWKHYNSNNSTKLYQLDSIENGQTKFTVTSMDRPPRPWFVLRAIGFLGDVGVGACTSFGFWMVYYFPTVSKHLNSLTKKLPLFGGDGVLPTDSLCDTITQEIKKHSAVIQKEVNDPKLKTFLEFADNCQRRRAYKDYLQRCHEQGLVVSLGPFPGVPPNFKLSKDDLNKFGTNDNNWAASFAIDVEDDTGKKD